MRYKTISISTAAVLLLALGCKKEEHGGPAPAPASGSTLRDLFDQHVADATQDFTLNTATGGLITGAQGTQLWFGPNAFLHANGSAVVGTVEVKLVEAMDVGDMIWLNKRTVGNDAGTERLLRSGGELKVSAVQAGEELRIVDNGLTVMVPTMVADPDMDVFVGTEDTDGRMLWDPMDSTTVTIVPDSSSGGAFYLFEADSLQWINCDYFYMYPNTTNITATIPVGQPTDSTMLWIAFPSENVVMEMNVTAVQTYGTWQVIPVGMSAVVVGLYRNGSSYYSSFNPVTVATSMNVPMTFSPTTLPQFQSDIDAL